MARYLMLGRYSLEGVKGIKKERTKKVLELVKKQGGRINAMHALVGNYDLAFIADFPNNAALIKASVGISKATGIGFNSLPAISVEDFDRVIG